MRTLFAPVPLVCGEIELAAEEAHHARSVLRLAVDDVCRVIDGRGQVGQGRVCQLSRHSLRLAVSDCELMPPPLTASLRVALAAPKGARLDDTLRGLVELGVGNISFLNTSRAQRQPNLQRLQRVCREALKQCRSPYLPELTVVEDVAAWHPPGRVVVLDPQAQALDIGAPQATTLIIGPEGGLTAEEESRLLGLGAERLRLTSTILRIETAAIAAAAVWAHAWEHHV